MQTRGNKDKTTWTLALTPIRIRDAPIQRRIRLGVFFQLAQMIVRVELVEHGFKLLQRKAA